MDLDVVVDLASPTPPYEQIRAQIAGHVLGGLLPLGSRLPTMRALAADLGVAVGTVARAYAELEAAGLVTSRRRTGTVITGGPPARSAGEERVHLAADRLVAEARAAGIGDDALLAILRVALGAAHVVSPSGGPSAGGTARTGR